MRKVLGFITQTFRRFNFPWGYVNSSFSQEGEDLILARIFGEKEKGFYVDVGAHHPIRFSNTYLFYRKGWSGLNIDAMPGSMKSFEKIRGRDINIETAVSNRKSCLNFHIFNEPALNTFSKDLAKDYMQTGYTLVDTQEIITRPLSTILRESLPTGTHIDFMSIDVEGEDMNVLMSNDWNKFRPDYLLVEILGVSSLQSLMESSEYKLLSSYGYDFFAKSVNTVFFKNKSCDSL